MITDISTLSRILGVTPYGNASDRTIDTLLTDSRSLDIAGSSIFFAIKTPTADGARYVRPLYERGVRAFVVESLPDDTEYMPEAAFFVVGNTVAALQKIAGYHPEFHGVMVGITGSRGKTTLKEWIFQLMEPLAEIIRSPRSYNSQIGVPLSLWQLQPDTDIALIEAGISRRSEMKHLADCIAPDVAIITNVGSAHSEGFESMEEKAAEKALLAKAPSVKHVIYCNDSPLLSKALSGLHKEKDVIEWSTSDSSATLYVSVLQDVNSTTRLDYDFRHGQIKGSLRMRLSSDTDIENAINALAFMLLQGIDRQIIAERFASLHQIGTRLNVSEGINGCSIVYDSYTSDFTSLTPALDFIRRRATPGQTFTVILSCLRHEASGESDLYTRMSRLMMRYGVTRFIGVGDELKRHASSFPSGSLFFSTTAELLNNLSPSDFSDEIILMKGAPEYDFGSILEMLEAKTHETVLEVNLDAVVKNYNYFRQCVPHDTRMIAMVKASGYGAGSYEIAKTLQDCGAAYLAVAVLDEGIDLRRQGITMPIMVMNPKVVNYRAMFANGLEPEVYSMQMLHDMVREAAKAGVTGYPIHIKLDTGMHRMGFVESELPALMDYVTSQRGVRICSVFSHLATADCPDMNDYTELQLQRFKQYSDYIVRRNPTPVLRHVLNSAGILRYPDHHYDMVRLGIGLYGVNTLPPEMEKPLATVSSLRTVIIAIREYKAGETIGYGRRGLLKRDSRVATIPIGYADGMNRHFGCGAISVRVNGYDAPTLGNICMDACMIDVTGIDCKEGDAVEIFGSHADVQRLADVLGTIPYEILTSVSPRVKRVYYRN